LLPLRLPCQQFRLAIIARAEYQKYAPNLMFRLTCIKADMRAPVDGLMDWFPATPHTASIRRELNLTQQKPYVTGTASDGNSQ
jgi:hypothetical protein